MKSKTAKSKIKQILTNLGDYSFEVNEWGSCQYSGALATYNAYKELRKHCSIKESLAYLGFKLKSELEPLPQDTASRSFLEGYRDHILDNERGQQELWAKFNALKTTDERVAWLLDLYKYPGREYTDQEIAKYTEQAKTDWVFEREEYDQERLDAIGEFLKQKDITLSECFDFLKNEAWDLWSAAPELANHAFKELDIEDIEDAKSYELESGLPLLNQMMQGENGFTGISCALLNEFFQCDTNDFTDFST